MRVFAQQVRVLMGISEIEVEVGWQHVYFSLTLILNITRTTRNGVCK